MKKFRIAHIFSGIGGKGLGAARAIARHGNIEASFETIGGIDFDPLACKDFEMLVGAPLVLAGTSHTRWREAIGNAVPPDAAERIAEQLLRSLLLSALGAFALDNNEVWVAPKEALVA